MAMNHHFCHRRTGLVYSNVMKITLSSSLVGTVGMKCVSLLHLMSSQSYERRKKDRTVYTGDEIHNLSPLLCPSAMNS